jgi:hypothetical protein
MNLDYVRNEISGMRVEIRRRKCSDALASAELLLARTRAKVDDLCNRRAKLR